MVACRRVPGTQTSVGDLIQSCGKFLAKWTYVISLEREFHKLSNAAKMRRYERLCGTENLKQIRASKRIVVGRQAPVMASVEISQASHALSSLKVPEVM